MRSLHLLLLSLSALIALPVVAGSPVPMWRLDFKHEGGNAAAETFEIEQLLEEPQHWSGPTQDRLERGDYKVELFEAGAEKPWFSYSYSSVYSDWSHGVEATNSRKTFQESVRFPAPEKDSTLVISRRKLDQDGQPFERVWHTSIEADAKPATAQSILPAIARDLAIQGAPESHLDLLFIAEGFTEKEQEKFFAAAQQASEALFDVEPYASLRDKFNVRALFLPSREATLGGDTALKVNPNALGMARYALTMEDHRLRNAAMQVPYDNIVILTNSSTYSASGIYRSYTVVPVFEPRMRFLLVHELGHHLAGLADEYFHATPGYANAEKVVEPHEPNVTALLDKQNLKWAHLVKPSTPLPTPWQKQRYLDTLKGDQSWLLEEPYIDEVGAFQGANYSPTQYYRPTLNCLMLRDGGDNRFCPVCANGIREVVEATAGIDIEK